MVAGERLALNDDPPSIFGRSIEARHEKMQIGSQCLHNDDFARKCADNLGRLFLDSIINV